MYNKTPIYLFDLDDVAFLFTESFWEQISTLHPKVQIPHISVSNSFNLASTAPGLTKEMIQSVFNSPGFFRNLKPAPGVVKLFNKLEEQKVNAFIVSAPYPTNPLCASEKLESVAEHFGSWWVERTILTRDKTVIRGDYLFDDKPTITGIQRPEWEHVIWDQPYNQNVSNRFRVKGWAECETFIESHN